MVAADNNEPVPQTDRVSPPTSCTVVVCTRERPHHLRACLAALRRSNGTNFSVLVVDNAPRTEASHDVAREFGVGYVVEESPGLSRARNRGVKESTSEIVAFIDDDALAEPGWLQALVTEFANPAVAAVGGRVVPVVGTEASARAGRLRGSYLPGESRLEVDRYTPDWFAQTNFGALGIGASMAFRRAVFDRWKGFDTRLGRGTPLDVGEETYAFAELVKLGHRVVYTPDAVVQHPYDPPKTDLAARRIASRASLTGYLTFLLVEEPRWAPQTLRYIRQRLSGRPPAWRGHLDPADDVIPRWRAALALASGPFIYLRTLLFGPRRLG
jgi:GT2 family glycosyltransferase